MTKEQIELFIVEPFKSILDKLGIDLSMLEVNPLAEGATFFLKEKNPGLFSIDKIRFPKAQTHFSKANIKGGFFFYGMNTKEQLVNLVENFPSELSDKMQVSFYNRGSGKGVPYVLCTLELMEQLFDQPSVFEHFQQRYDQPFKVRKKGKITELIENLEFNDADSVLKEQLSQQENYDVDTIEGIKALEEKMRAAIPEVQKIIAFRIERGAISDKIKAITRYKCLVCEQLGLPPLGFQKKNSDEYYIESHHVNFVSTRKKGSLSATNIITLCANHHRQMHYGNVSFEENEDSFVFQIDGQRVEIQKIKIPEAPEH